MPLREVRIWVLITDGATARICSTEDGVATPVLVPMLSSDYAEAFDLDWENRAYRVWFRAESQAVFPKSASRQLALHLAQLLNEGARDGAFDGLIVIAAPQIRRELQQALSAQTRALLVGRVVRDLASIEAAEADFASELRN